jgi:hypothetical protein
MDLPRTNQIQNYSVRLDRVELICGTQIPSSVPCPPTGLTCACLSIYDLSKVDISVTQYDRRSECSQNSDLLKESDTDTRSQKTDMIAT